MAIEVILTKIIEIITWPCRAIRRTRCCRKCLNKDEFFLADLARNFDPFKFKEHEECSICLMPFDETSKVIPLPCDTRHYFHAKCIETWTETNKSCPLCKKWFTAKEMRDYHKKFSILANN